MSIAIKITELKKNYFIGDVMIPALSGVNLSVTKGEIVAIMGASGCGKSTLMNIIGCLDKASSGDYILDGISVMQLDDNQRANIRNKKIGFIFQSFNLLSRSTALENVELPLIYNRDINGLDCKKMAYNALEKVGLEDRVNHQAQQLSGGQQQRVAIARALVNNPTILLADEPTGNLDSKTSNDIMKLFLWLNNQNITIILVTHDKIIAEYADKRFYMKDGLIMSE